MAWQWVTSTTSCTGKRKAWSDEVFDETMAKTWVGEDGPKGVTWNILGSEWTFILRGICAGAKARIPAIILMNSISDATLRKNREDLLLCFAP